MLAVDLAGYTRPERDDDIRRYLHEELYRVLEQAFDVSGVPWAGCFVEDRGDGALVVMPSEIAAKPLISPLPNQVHSLIRRHNHVSREAARIQLRMAVHLGPVEHDGHGFVGSDVNFLFRMLEARQLRRALADADLAVAISEYVYNMIVCRYPSLLSPNAFQPVRFQVKGTRARAWIYVPASARG